MPLLGLLNDLADVGVILLMLVAGLETDLDQMRKVGTAAFWSAAGGVVLPMIGGILTASAFGMPVFWTGIFIGTILTATSVSISAQVLMELGVLQIEGRLDDPRRRRDRRCDGHHRAVGRRRVRAGRRRRLPLADAVIVGRMVLFFGGAILFGAILRAHPRLGRRARK